MNAGLDSRASERSAKQNRHSMGYRGARARECAISDRATSADGECDDDDSDDINGLLLLL